MVKINAVDVDPAMASAFEERFAKRAGAVEKSPGFEAFELMRPADGGGRYFVYTRWASEEAFQGWLASQDFAKAHAHVVAETAGDAQPVGHGSQLLAFEVVDRVDAAPTEAV